MWDAVNFRRYVQKATLTLLKTHFKGLIGQITTLFAPLAQLSASRLKWGEIQLYKGILIQLWNRFNFLAIFRAPQDLSKAG